MKPVIIIAQEPYAATLRSAVESIGLRAEYRPDFAGALEGIHERKYSLALIAIERSGAAGDQARDVSRFVPVIVLTPGCGGDLCVNALECGADDCVPHSVSTRELSARMRNVLRRSGMAEEPSQAVLQTLTEMRARVNGRTVDLTGGEVEVLSVLTDEAPRPVTALEIAERLDARRGTIEARIKSLRAKLGSHRLISRGRLGYVYVADGSGTECPAESQ